MDKEKTHLAAFHAFLRGGVAASLARVQSSPLVVPEQDRQQAWHILSFALGVADMWEEAAALLLALAPKMERAGFGVTWLPYLERGLMAAQVFRDRPVEAELSLAVGHLRQRLGELPTAETHVQHAVDLFRSLGSPLRLGAALNRLAEVVRLRQDIARAERLTDESLSLLAGDNAEQGHAYLIKSRIAFSQRNWQVCRNHLERALAFCVHAGDERRIAVCLLNLARVCQMEEDYAGAMDYNQRAIALLEQLGDIFNCAVAQMNVGIVHSLVGEPQAALTQYARAENVFRRLHDNRYLAKLANNQGMEMHNLRRWQEAIELFQRSSALFLECAAWQEYVNSQDNLGLVYLAQGERAAAVELYAALLAQMETSQLPIHPHLRAELEEHLCEARKIS